MVGLACLTTLCCLRYPGDKPWDVLPGCFRVSVFVVGWPRSSENVHKDDYLEFIDDLRFVYLDELHIGPKLEDMVTFLSSGPKLIKREKTSYVFKLSCLCLGHVLPELPNVSLGSPSRSGTEIDLADVIEPLQISLLISSVEQNLFPSVESVFSCVELLTEFGEEALQPSYDSWASVDFHGRAKTLDDLTKTYKDVSVAANVETYADVTLSSGSPEILLPQKKHPAQRPRIDSSKTPKAVAAKTCASKLRSSRPDTSGDAC